MSIRSWSWQKIITKCLRVMNKTFIYGRHTYNYELIEQQRKTLCLIVEPCMDITLKAPVGAGNEKIEEFLQRKWAWLNKQLTFFKQYKKVIQAKAYVSGERFYYLGRQYQLTVCSGKKNSVSFVGGRLILETSGQSNNTSRNKALLDKWYQQRMQVIFTKEYKKTLTQFGYEQAPTLVIRAMPRRWGSFVKGKKIILNPLLIQAPRSAICYVITHELCHMRYKRHNTQFYRFLGSKFPNWQKTKAKLESFAQPPGQ